MLLDFASTSIVSAATAASYLAGEVDLPFPTFTGALIVLVIFTLISLSGVKESARIALIVLLFHVGFSNLMQTMIQRLFLGGDDGCSYDPLNYTLAQVRHVAI